MRAALIATLLVAASGEAVNAASGGWAQQAASGAAAQQAASGGGAQQAASGSGAQQAAPGVEAPKERVPTDIRRLTILVRDMERSLKLYRDVLGLKVNYDADIKVSGVALPAGVPGNMTRLVLLNGNDPWIGWIGLMEYIDPPLPNSDKPYPLRLGPGGHVLVTNTDDAVKRCTMAKTVPGVQFTAEPRLQTYAGRNGGPDIKVMGCNFFDPDGTFIELNQILTQ